MRIEPGEMTFRKSFDRLARKQMPFAASEALNSTAFDIYREEKNALDKYLDRPTPFTKKAYRVKKSTKRRLVAYVGIKKIQADYLRWQIKGGYRSPRDKVITLPVKIKKNKYGNIPAKRTKFGKLLEDKIKYFEGIPRGRVHNTLGLYQRMGASKDNRAGKSLRMLVAYDKEKVKYKPNRLPFYDVANKITKARFAVNLRKAVNYARATAR